MNILCQQLSDLLDQKDVQIAALQKQTGVVTLSGIQSVLPEALWYEARSANAPKTGPHGTVSFSLGEPTTVGFHPIALPGGSSDNVYCLRREYFRMSENQKVMMEEASEFSIGCDVALNPLTFVQAFELDYQIRKSSGVVINVGLQLLPLGTSWQLRGFDYVKKDWETIGVPVTPTPGKTNHIAIHATCDDKTVHFTEALVDGVTAPVDFSHPVSLSTPNSPYLNVAYQLDGTKDGKPYTATVGHLEVTWQP